MYILFWNGLFLSCYELVTKPIYLTLSIYRMRVCIYIYVHVYIGNKICLNHANRHVNVPLHVYISNIIHICIVFTRVPGVYVWYLMPILLLLLLLLHWLGACNGDDDSPTSSAIPMHSCSVNAQFPLLSCGLT